MKIVVLADSHDHLENLKKVLAAVKDTDEMLHCGDIIAPFSVKAIGEQYSKRTHIVWGNNDGDRKHCEERAKPFSQITIHGDDAFLVIGGKKIAMNHYPDKAEDFAKSGKYDLVCYGHTHRVDLREAGKTIILNPGEVMGMYDSKAHYALYDTETNKVELKSVDANPA